MANSEHLEILKQGVEVWNKWRKANSNVVPNLAESNLSQLNLTDADLQGVILREANLYETKFVNARLTRADLFKAFCHSTCFKNALMSEVNLKHADLTQADLRGATLKGAALIQATLFQAKLEGAMLDDAILKQAKLISVDLSGMDLSRMELTSVDLTESRLRNTDLLGAKLSNATCIRTNFTRANLRGADFRNSNMFNADVSYANLSNANLTAVILEDGYLNEADLSRAKLLGADLSGARLEHTILANVDLTKTKGLRECEHWGPSTINDGTLELSANLPESFLRSAGLSEERIRAYLYGNTITVEFTRERWGQLTPIEAALTAVLGNDYVAEKREDRIVVRLNAPEQLEVALDAVVPVLAAIHKTVPGVVKSIQAAEKGEEPLLLRQMDDKLDIIIRHFQTSEAVNEKNKSKLLLHEQALVETVKGGPRKLAALALEKWFVSGERIAEKLLDPICWKIYENYLWIIGGLSKTLRLRQSEQSKELPPTEDDH